MINSISLSTLPVTSVTASAPGKLMLAGSYAVVHGRSCVATAVDQRLQVTVTKNGQNTFRMEAPELDLIKYSKTIDDLGKKQLPKAVRFIELFYKRFLETYPQQEGIDVVTSSDFSASVGFGSSSAVTVAFGKALTTLYQIELTNKQLFDWCYQTVIDVQGVGSGYDIAMAIWGGTLLYQWPAARVEPISVAHLPLVVGYTGVKADTATLVRVVDEKYEQNKAAVGLVFDQIGQVAEQMKEALATKDWQDAGRLLTQHHGLTQQLGISTQTLDSLVNAANQAGAYGAGLSGAGGGDCMVALVAEDTRALVNVDAPGVKIHA
jgi:mevalonate kinase